MYCSRVGCALHPVLKHRCWRLIEPVLVPIWVYVAWSHHPSYEAPQWWTWAGGGLILLGLLSRYLPPMLRGQMVRRGMVEELRRKRRAMLSGRLKTRGLGMGLRGI